LAEASPRTVKEVARRIARERIGIEEFMWM